MRTDHGRSRGAKLLVVTLALALVVGCAELLSELDLDPLKRTATPTDGLREALAVGTARAVDRLSRPNGYLLGPGVKIPVPDRFDTLAKALRRVGAGEAVDEFVASMNRAAEAAAPLARQVFLDTVRELSFADALAILRGEDHEATDYLREHAGTKLEMLFSPIVAEKLDSVGATREFGELMDEVSKLPFYDRPAFDLGEYVTGKALDGLFLRIGEEERKIREDPVARTTELLRKFFDEDSPYRTGGS